MPKKIPYCAYCGFPMNEEKNTERILLYFQCEKGRPMIGWHRNCSTYDQDLFDVAKSNIIGFDYKYPLPDDHMPWAIKVIAFRGYHRVSAGAKFWGMAIRERAKWIYEIINGGEIVLRPYFENQVSDPKKVRSFQKHGS